MIIKEVKKLRERVTEHWSFENPKQNTKELAKELVDAMWSHSGLGISANQIGHNYRVFAMRGETQKDSIVCFNPEIKDFSPEMNTMEEGCLSFSLSQVDNKFIIYETVLLCFNILIIFFGYTSATRIPCISKKSY